MCVFSRFRWRLRSGTTRRASDFCPACPPASRLPTLSMGCVRTAKTKNQNRRNFREARRAEPEGREPALFSLRIIITLSF